MSSLSSQFAARLERLEPNRKIRAVVLLKSAVGRTNGGRRQSSERRQATVEAVRQEGESGLKEIDRVLGKFGGRRLGADVSALGSVLVETTAGGIKALGALERVKTVLEDQVVKLTKA